MTTDISISGYGDYSSDNYGVNCLRVCIGNLTLYFSYQTVVAFRSNELGLVIRENDWSTTTGKHLNWIDPEKKIRISGEEFEKLLSKTLKKHKLSI
jgi:hypothetical protein